MSTKRLPVSLMSSGIIWFQASNPGKSSHPLGLSGQTRERPLVQQGAFSLLIGQPGVEKRNWEAWGMASLFREIETFESFRRIIKQMLVDAPASVIRCIHDINDDNFGYAFNEYIAGVQRFAARLHSQDPDHRKRASALIRAIVVSQLVRGAEM